jgi:hypothetical protein
MFRDLDELELPGLELVDPNADYSGTQTIFVDFDGAEGVSYDNEALNVHIGGLSVADSGLSQIEQLQILSDLNTTFAGTGVTFTATAPVNEEYSTIYVGGNDSAFSEYDSFRGLAETIDAGNLIKNDEAFVFSDKINSTAAITETIAHETGHLLGFAHEGDSIVSELGDFAATLSLSQLVTDGYLTYSEDFNGLYTQIKPLAINQTDSLFFNNIEYSLGTYWGLWGIPVVILRFPAC